MQNSFYPEPLKNSIPYSQYPRLCRNCSTDSDFLKEADNLRLGLKQHGYIQIPYCKKPLEKVKTNP